MTNRCHIPTEVGANFKKLFSLRHSIVLSQFRVELHAI